MWLPIPGFPDYDVSDLGQVRSRRRKTTKVLKLRPHKYGYKLVRLYTAPYQWKDFTVHSLVMLTFVGPRPEGLCIRHLDGDAFNNSLSNLTYGTLSENVQDSINHGTLASKLTVCEVRIIRKLHKLGATYSQLSEMFSVDPKSIGRLIRRQHWKHIE